MGLRVQIPGKLTFPIIQRLADDVLTVTDEEIIATTALHSVSDEVAGRDFGRDGGRGSDVSISFPRT